MPCVESPCAGKARVALVRSIGAGEQGRAAAWIKGNRNALPILCDIDPVQIGEAVTGRLNPENTKPAFQGRVLWPAKGAINASGHNALQTPSPISDNTMLPAFGAPANANYRGLAAAQTDLDKLLTSGA